MKIRNMKSYMATGHLLIAIIAFVICKEPYQHKSDQGTVLWQETKSFVISSCKKCGAGHGEIRVEKPAVFKKPVLQLSVPAGARP